MVVQSPYHNYRIMPLIEVLLLAHVVCFSYLATRWHMFMMEDPVRLAYVCTHTVWQSAGFAQPSVMCAHLLVPHLSVLALTVYVCVCYVMNTLAFYSSLTDARPSDLPYIHVYQCGLHWIRLVFLQREVVCLQRLVILASHMTIGLKLIVFKQPTLHSTC